MNLILALVAIGGVGFFLLRKPLDALKDEASAAEAFGDSGVQQRLEAAATTASATQQAQMVAANALLNGDLVTAAIAGLASLVTYKSVKQRKRAWADMVKTVWLDLPDSWFLERSPQEAGAAIAAYVPHPFDPNGNAEHPQWWDDIMVDYEIQWAYDNIRRTYFGRIETIHAARRREEDLALGVVMRTETIPEKIARIQLLLADPNATAFTLAIGRAQLAELGAAA